MDELLGRLIHSAADSGVQGVLTTLGRRLAARSAVFALGGALLASYPKDLNWGYQEILAAGADQQIEDFQVFSLKTSSDTVLGFFAVDVAAANRGLLASVADLISLEVRRLGAKAEGRRTLFRDVLDDIITARSSPPEIRTRLQSLGLTPDAEVKVLVGVCRAPAHRLSRTPWEIYALSGKLQSSFLRSEYNGAMVMVIPHSALADEIADRLLGRLEELASPATVGMSEMASLDGIRTAYFQALAATTNGTGIQTSGSFDLTALLAQNNLPDSVVKAAQYLLAPLIDYDAVHGTDFLDTLRAYLQYDRKVIAVAESFFMHRNTIRYRLRQISEIIHADLDPTRDLVNLTIALQLYDAGYFRGRSI